MATVLGIDVAAGRWVGVLLRDGRFDAASVQAELRVLLEELPADVVAVDMPIGLPPLGERRPADDAAKRLLGPRRSSLFYVPPREVLAAATHAEATALATAHGGKGISQQSFALRRAIAEVAVIASDDDRVHEAHPECSFTEMGGAPPTHSKKTWAGSRARARLLAARGIELPEDLGPAGAVPTDDVLDAAACAWTATRIAAGTALPLPAGATGRDGVIWR